jgi:hypothetical protein
MDPNELVDAVRPVPLLELEGLTEDQARRWAQESGFEIVVRSDEDRETILIPTRRVVLEVDDNGIVTGATAG